MKSPKLSIAVAVRRHGEYYLSPVVSIGSYVPHSGAGLLVITIRLGHWVCPVRVDVPGVARSRRIMRVTLVYPNYGEGKRSKYFPFGLAYVASSMMNAGADVTVVDMEGSDLSVNRALGLIMESAPDMVGFGGMVTRYRIVKELGTRLRESMPDLFMIAGNSGASTVPALYLSNCGIDAVVMGEGELTSAELVARIAAGDDWRDVGGLAYLERGGLQTSGSREPIDDLDSLPYPAWDLFPVQNYIRSPDHRQKTQPHMEVVASRGCPYNCVYCYHIYGRRVRRRSSGSIVSEIEELVRRFGVEYTGFPDDLFTSDRDFVMETCRLMRERLPNIRWSCIGRVNMVDREMLDAMRDAGCDWISFGIESGSDRMLARMKRSITSEDCLRGIRITREAGIHAEGSFIIGMFGETEETVRETVDFCRRADITAPMLFVTPYPGTEIFEEAAASGLIPDLEAFLERMNAADQLLVNLTDMSDVELRRLRDWAQGRIGRNYLLRKPLSRVPALLFKHLSLRGLRGLLRDLRELFRSFRKG
jgi:anaerobic magnesium-protoporphyrin IX monomethyl ester cyclase